MMKKPNVKEMTIREKVGQCVCIRQYDLLQKTEVDEYLPRPLEERDEILQKNPYGVLWCAGNQNLKNINMSEKNYGNYKVTSDEYREWIKGLNKNWEIPGLMATDAESSGAGTIFSDLTIVGSGLSIGAANSEELSYELGVAVGKELRCAGINWRWAPVADLPSRFSMSCMRPFSLNPDQLVRLASAHIKGMQSVGVAATLKHFPGSDGYEYRDSHFTNAALNISMEEWWERQRKVFQKLIDSGAYSVMIAHETFESADDTMVNGKLIPSTLSKKIITDLLKGKMGFEGVVITDAVGMAGLQACYPYQQLLVELIKAGNDVLLGTGLDAVDILEQAVLNGELPEERVDDACRRVLEMKEKLGLFDEDYRIDEYRACEVTPRTREVDNLISEKSITLIRDKQNRLPFDKNQVKKVSVICSTHDDTFMDRMEVLKAELEKMGMEVRMQRRLSSFEEIQEINQNSDLILYAAYLAPHRPKGAMSFYDEECQTFGFAFTEGNEKSVGVSFGYPYIFYDFMGNADICVNAYSTSDATIKAFAKTLFGDLPMDGVSPVKLNPDRRVF
ncbi:MAG: glycoside hydrolase family 3 protein [Ruminococcaceae bacterium]|nr:glycoside hydrolase family 3 protein [Oscillospiraceae bacterium]